MLRNLSDICLPIDSLHIVHQVLLHCVQTRVVTRGEQARLGIRNAPPTPVIKTPFHINVGKADEQQQECQCNCQHCTEQCYKIIRSELSLVRYLCGPELSYLSIKAAITADQIICSITLLNQSFNNKAYGPGQLSLLGKDKLIICC